MKAVNCYHCGDECGKDQVEFDHKSFCCLGCKTVYEILNQNSLMEFYELNKTPGIKPKSGGGHQFDFLNTPQIFEKIIDFDDDGTTLVTFFIPVIHCSSCVWVLESLQDLHPAIQFSHVNFPQRKVQISYRSDELKLADLAQFLANLGYKPSINLENLDKKEQKKDRSLVFQLVIAGFCFGNIMLLAFPEYVNPEETWLTENRLFFRWLMFGLSLPVVLYSASSYLKSAYFALKTRKVNIDIPIAIGILVLFFRSTYEVVADLSPGYFDSLAGLVFFMLIGKWFQQRTYQSLAFDRDYKSFYPIAVTKIDENQNHENILLSELKKGDRILLRDEEILPADAILIKGSAYIDNSFITGESRLIHKKTGDKIYAGGKQNGAAIELEIIEEVNQSYLTSLWNHDTFRPKNSFLDNLINQVSRYFVYIILSIALISGIFWYFYDTSQMFQVITAVLIIACPCALALAAPFTLGNLMRIMGRKAYYAKEAFTLEKMNKIDTLVFDKTGTLTQNDAQQVRYEGDKLSGNDKTMIYSLAMQSNHPLSQMLQEFFKGLEKLEVKNYQQIKGKGQKAEINDTEVALGSHQWIAQENEVGRETEVWYRCNGKIKGRFVFENQYRKNLSEIFKGLKNYDIHLLSGDNDHEREILGKIIQQKQNLNFNQSPQDKLNYIKNLQEKGRKVMMIGDGLNDAGALQQSDVGVAVAEDMNSFSPSCDAILAGGSFRLLPYFLKLSQKGIFLVKIAFVISFLYNIIGLSFAVTGNLEPVVAAILMPVSSISVVLFATLGSWFLAYRLLKK